MTDVLVTIRTSQLRRLLRDSITLEYLEGGGVDNWGWYGDSIHDGLRRDFGDEEYRRAIDNDEYDELKDRIVDKYFNEIIE